jgi:hypothetical protein
MSVRDMTPDLGSKSVVRASWLFLCMAAIIVGTVGLTVLATNEMDLVRPEIILPLIVIIGLVALLATIAAIAAVFGLFEITDRTQALGLPAGSVQGIIALGLILIFAVVGLYAASTSGTENVTTTGLTKAQFEALPIEQVVQGTPVTDPNTGDVSYSVIRRIEDPDKNSINIQLLTTVSTLVIAVAGFYFGSKSVQEGSKAALAAAGETRTLNVVDPASPHAMKRSDGPLTIKLESAPPGARLKWSIQGDDEGELTNRADDTFDYKPGSSGEPGAATLNFEHVDDPKVTASLVVNLLASEETGPTVGPGPGPVKTGPAPAPGPVEPETLATTAAATEHEAKTEAGTGGPETQVTTIRARPGRAWSNTLLHLAIGTLVKAPSSSRGSPS